jgi:hypothetical protein
MAQFSLDVADADIVRVTNAMCGPINIGFNLPAADSIDPETARQRAIAFILQVVHAYELALASESIVPPDIS